MGVEYSEGGWEPPCRGVAWRGVAWRGVAWWVVEFCGEAVTPLAPVGAPLGDTEVSL